MCVIADDRAVLGFGGILGGEETLHAATKNVLIECAYFALCAPLRRAAGRRAERRPHRFERGVDPAFVCRASTSPPPDGSRRPAHTVQAQGRGAPPEDPDRIPFATRWSRSSRIRLRRKRSAPPSSGWLHHDGKVQR